MTRTLTSKPLLPPVPAALTAMLSIQAGAAVAKGLFATIGALGTTSLRLALAALILGAIHQKALRSLDVQGWKAILPYGLVLGMMNLTFYQSVQHLPLGLAVTIEFIGPLGVAVFSSRKPMDYLWAVLAGLGILLISPWAPGSRVSLIGIFWAVLAGVFWGLYIVMGQRVLRQVSSRQAVAGGMLIACLLPLPLGLFTTGAKLFEPSILLFGLMVAVLSSALPYSLEMVALKALPARTFGILMSVEPAIAAVLGLLLLQEHLTPLQWVAVVCVIGASIGSTLGSRDTSHAEVLN
ncbi:EamA family transporter [Deinococcus roseus]|uniref:Threonine transporter RhtB n=1 Tax=Deinococcus roseus TaxID=392414 RepID=A0ABQ2CYC1_9DEIO|nr:DMT family transporter [Deinococcus roseus]GGJ32856.1 threonine transporter RhtB [Deinococcus roseus]